MTSDKSYITEARLTTLVNGIDSWHPITTMKTGWTISGVFEYKAVGIAGLVIVKIRNIAPLTTDADGTVIVTAANGLPSAYRPADNTRAPLYSNAGGGTEQPAFEFETDGSIQIFGTGSTTISRLDGGIILLSTL